MKFIEGMLVLYHHELLESAPTVMDHVRAFSQSEVLPVWAVNTGEGFPPELASLSFRVIVIHYSLCGCWPYLAAWKEENRKAFFEYVRGSTESLKVAFFQDEHHDCQQRFQFINDCAIDCVYSLLDPAEVPKVYGRYTPTTEFRLTLTVYVPDDLIGKARKWSKPLDTRRIDVGYRGRPLPYFMGRAAQEKTFIANEFVRRVEGSGLRLDIKTAEEDRIYGDNWYRFIADCKAMIGVEAGVSVFDLDGSAQTGCETLLAQYPDASFEMAYDAVLHRYENQIYYRTISPRVFEAAAFRTCLILFEGRYNDLLEPGVHYIPLKKDFSNLDEVLRTLADPKAVERITSRAYADLIASGAYSFRAFIKDFDEYLREKVGAVSVSAKDHAAVDRVLTRGRRRRRLRRRFEEAKMRVWNRLHEPFPGKAALKPVFGPLAIWLFTRRD